MIFGFCLLWNTFYSKRDISLISALLPATNINVFYISFCNLLVIHTVKAVDWNQGFPCSDGPRPDFLPAHITNVLQLFFNQGFLSRALATHRGQQGKGGDHFLFHSTISTRSQTFRHLFETLHVRWLSHIFNRTTCIYQTADRWDLPPYWITIWLIDEVTLIFLCLLDDLILGFWLQQSWYGKPVKPNSHRLSPLYHKRID